MYKGACVLDLDQTLTCSKTSQQCDTQHMKRVIDMCRDNNMLVAINTARPPQRDILHSIPPDVRAKIEDSPVYDRPVNADPVPLHKLMNMHRIAKDFNLNVQNTILVDDLDETCDLFKKMNVPVIHVKHGDGITREEADQIKTFLQF